MSELLAEHTVHTLFHNVKDTSICAIILLQLSRLKPSVFNSLSEERKGSIIKTLQTETFIRESVADNMILLTFGNHSVKDSSEFVGINLHVLREETVTMIVWSEHGIQKYISITALTYPAICWKMALNCFSSSVSSSNG